MASDLGGHSVNCPHCGAKLSEIAQQKAYCDSCDKGLRTSEACPKCGAMHERGDDGKCNACRADWPVLPANTDDEEHPPEMQGALKQYTEEFQTASEHGNPQSTTTNWEAEQILKTLKKSSESASYERMLAAQQEDDSRKRFIQAVRDNRKALDEMKAKKDDEEED